MALQCRDPRRGRAGRGAWVFALSACYGTEAQCEQALEQARWPDGFVCPACGEGDHSRFLVDGRCFDLSSLVGRLAKVS